MSITFSDPIHIQILRLTIGRARLGYLNVRKDFDGRLVNTVDVDAERAPLIQWAFNAYASGEYTLQQLHYALAEQGLTTRPSPRRAAQPVSASQLSVILHDPYYTGVMPFKGELYPGRHHPLISKDLFLRVQDVLAERARRGQRDRVHHHYLKGLLFCGRCAAEGRTSRLIFTEITGNGGTYQYFICRARQDGLCDLGSLPLAEIEAAIARRFAALELPQDFIDTVRAEVLTVLEDSQEADIQVRANLTKQLKKLDDREERFLDLAADDELSTKKLRERIRTIKLERASIQERLDRTDTQITRGAQTLLTYLDLLTNPGQLYNSSTGSVRRQLLDAFYSQLLADEDPDSIEAIGIERPAVAELQQAVRAMRTSLPTQSKSPRSSTRASALVTPVGSLSDLFHGRGLSKTTMVGLTRFELATP